MSNPFPIKRLSIKDIRCKREVSSADIFWTRGEGVLQMRTSTLFGVKNSDFSKFMVCPHGQGERGSRQYGHFSDKGRVHGGQFFTISCGRLLWTALNIYCTWHHVLNFSISSFTVANEA